MPKIGFWSKNPRLGKDAWLNTSDGVEYTQVRVVKDMSSLERGYFVVVVHRSGRSTYAMNGNSSTSQPTFFTYTKAMSVARDFMRRNS